MVDLNSHLDTYKVRTGHEYGIDWDMDFYPLLKVFDDGSLLSYTFFDDVVEVGIGSVSDWKVAVEYLTKVARENDINKIAVITTRNPKAYARLVGGEHESTRYINGTYYHRVIKEI